ncbi:hypothetical protein ENSA5_37920 [Enhygromyxa salina]|uniref:Zinc-finger domain-containing protein n=1 Tax=Enhygromyxa salina TaxID=215803 RepID=A0A2S9XS24_9BACT|nr:hypothetical protein [Enhygromyxa salina]PRP95659.1 hypothetical protein ENSA5_37920 [Enhygromyxa salina]
MTLEPVDPDHAEVVALLQPFVDGELSDDEHELVARQIAINPEYQAIVREQQGVRAALRSLERELAPAGLRERILADLDAVEAEQRAAEQRGWFAPVVGRIKAFGRGAMLMVPAAAAAAVLFVVANNAGWLEGGLGGGGVGLDGALVEGGMAHSIELSKRGGGDHDDAQPEPQPSVAATPPAATPPAAAAGRVASGSELPSAADLSENLGFAVQVAPPRSLPADVALVSDSERAPGSSAMVRYRDGGGAVMVDRQRRAGVAPLHGLRQSFRGHDYYLARDAQGRAQLEFELGRVHHGFILEGGDARVGAGVSVDEPDFHGLLIVADALRRAHEG